MDKLIPTNKETPLVGEKVVVCNDISEWVTTWKPGLMASCVHFPVKYFSRYKRPYPAKKPLGYGLSMTDVKERQWKRK